MLKQETPLASRKHIGIFGNSNAGKSMLFNQIIGQDLSIVSEQEGTTTDPVIKAMELNPFGPVAFIDTAGFGDVSDLGDQRIKKTMQMIERCDYILYVADCRYRLQKDILKLFENIPNSIVFTKTDLLNEEKLSALKSDFPDAFFVNYQNENSIQNLKDFLAKQLKNLWDGDDNQLNGLVSLRAQVVMVVPIDSGAPKGRLILPQVTLIRNCLDLDVVCTITKEETLAETLKNLPKVDLVVTDSQIFNSVAKIVPKEIPLTSFSMLLANQKGDLPTMLSACDMIPDLKNGDKILMLEACTHNHTHEDIGRVKIPALLQKKTGVSLEFDYFVGYEFPEDLSQYQLAIHCGGCMITKKTILARLKKCYDCGLPLTNYGVILAYLNGILDRCSEVFIRDSKNN